MPVWLSIALYVYSQLAGATTLRWATPSDALSLDPHAQNEGLTNSINAHIYERLVMRDAQLALVPGLASSWKQVDALTWHFQLRAQVQFHDGSPLQADDVVFSIQRAQHPNSAVAQYARRLGRVQHLGGGVLEFRLEKPNPVLLDHMDAVPIMSRAWARKHGVLAPLSHKNQQESHAKHHAMGTGPFVLVSRAPDEKTVLTVNAKHWRTNPGNVSKLVIQPIGNALTRTAALVTGEVDVVTAPPLADLERLAKTPGISVRQTLENRVVFLGMDQHREELLYSSVKGRNPLKDLRVRQALAHAIDTETIQRVITLHQAQPTGCMLPSALTCQSMPVLDANRPKLDLEKSRQLLAAAGYAHGFELTLDCPNDRHVNDEALCVGLAGMLAKVGIQLKVQTLPRAQYYPKLSKLDTSFYLLAWGGAELDAQPTLEPLMHSFEEKSSLGEVNFGRFADAQLDALIKASSTETDTTQRQQQIQQAVMRHQQQAYHLVLYRQTLAWAMRSHVDAAPAANNHLRAWLITVRD
jgi:peptide/nickel transport system substrate-binding protein